MPNKWNFRQTEPLNASVLAVFFSSTFQTCSFVFNHTLSFLKRMIKIKIIKKEESNKLKLDSAFNQVEHLGEHKLIFGSLAAFLAYI